LSLTGEFFGGHCFDLVIHILTHLAGHFFRPGGKGARVILVKTRHFCWVGKRFHHLFFSTHCFYTRNQALGLG